MQLDHQGEALLIASELGMGKRTPLSEFNVQKRGGKGVRCYKITEKTGALIALINVNDEEDLMIINRSGITIRMKVSELRVLGRNTQGVKLINLRGKDFIASITKVPTENEEETPAEVTEDQAAATDETPTETNE